MGRPSGKPWGIDIGNIVYTLWGTTLSQGASYKLVMQDE
jgi:hypothetical protein